jgi:hypothetical protein
MRLILVNRDDADTQLDLALRAIREGIKAGDVWGFLHNDKAYGVKANKHSVRVYPPTPTQQGE